MLTIERLRELTRLTLSDPERGGTALMALNPGLQARWLALAAAVVLGVVVAYLLPLAVGRTDEAMSPFAAVALQGGVNLLAILMMTRVGRIFGGQGQFADAVLLVAWLQALMVLVQGVQLVALLILPPLAGLVTILAVALFFWLITGFVQALHGFASRLLVLFGVLGSMFAAAFVVSFLLILLGFDPRVMTDV
jgi:hypothetical protein